MTLTTAKPAPHRPTGHLHLPEAEIVGPYSVWPRDLDLAARRRRRGAWQVSALGLAAMAGLYVHCVTPLLA